IERFRRGEDWVASLADDAPSVPADDFDSPTPSPCSLAEMALQRSAALRTRLRATPPLRREQHGDFGNLATALAAGEVYLLERPTRPDWNSIPTNVIFQPSTVTSWCFRGVCTPGEAPSIWNPAP
ncbi:MAG: hypothetical protein MI724_06355, partial [Spirochaetales bacterium]|nr:hypothetical protein [Spirochaetales bacterium]